MVLLKARSVSGSRSLITQQEPRVASAMRLARWPLQRVSTPSSLASTSPCELTLARGAPGTASSAPNPQLLLRGVALIPNRRINKPDGQRDKEQKRTGKMFLQQN